MVRLWESIKHQMTSEGANRIRHGGTEGSDKQRQRWVADSALWLADVYLLLFKDVVLDQIFVTTSNHRQRFSPTAAQPIAPPTWSFLRPITTIWRRYNSSWAADLRVIGTRIRPPALKLRAQMPNKCQRLVRASSLLGTTTLPKIVCDALLVTKLAFPHISRL